LRSAAAHIGVDTGGTFTDFICLRGNQLSVLKLPSTPRNPAAAVLEGLRQLAPNGDDAIVVCYGSTVATNALLERRGARVVLMTTSGFEDLLEIGRQSRPLLYSLSPRKPEPLVPRGLRIGVPERTLHDGSIKRRLTPARARAVARRAARLGAEAVAVCFLHSYGVPVSLSHRLVHEYREYERLSTTVINAYVAPIVARHLRSLQAGIRGHLRVMQSSGGTAHARTIYAEPVRTILSGPAGGVIGATAIARRIGLSRIITLDMGGTSTDVCLIDSTPTRRSDSAIGGLPVRVPGIDIHTVGAGGGSVARLDAGGSLKVGPESAGADPGPACYGRGTAPTVTDANLILGRLVADEFLGGTMRIDSPRGHRAIGRLAKQTGLSRTATAEGIVRVVNASMERALRVISVERGLDPRLFTLVAFGGAAGLHACELADALGIRRVLVPPEPGLLSAWGMLAADIVKDYAASVLRTDVAPGALGAIYEPLVAQAHREMAREGIALRRVRLVRTLDLRYPGQSYEIEVPFGPRFTATFHRAHERLYGSSDRTRPIEIVTARLKAVAPAGIRLTTPGRGNARRGPRPQPRRSRAYWRGRHRPTVIWRRPAGLPARLPGAAVICEFSATTYVPPGWTAATDRRGNLVIKKTVERRS
jgi:N-methylhydantoinase A